MDGGGRTLTVFVAAALTASADARAPAQEAPKPTSKRALRPAEAPPRVFDNIRQFLRQLDLKFETLRVAPAGEGAATSATPGSGGPGAGGGEASTFGGALSAGNTDGSGGSGVVGGASSGGASDAALSKDGGAFGDDGKLAYDENGGTRDPRGPSNQTKGGDGKAPGESGLTIHSLWWPICFFIDNSVDQGTANGAVKGVVDMAAACGVTVVAFPVTARGFVNDHNVINQQQQSACNLTEVGLAPRASTTALVPFPDTAGAMCGETKWEQKIAVAGCATKAAGGAPPAPSIEVPKGHNAAVVAHEAMGHSQMNRPNLGEEGAYIDAGNGIGDYGGTPFAAAGGEGNIKTGSGWSPVGCAIMRANALPNTKSFAYDANRQLYYVKQENPERQHDMGSGRRLFGDPSAPPPPGTPLQLARGGADGGATPAGGGPGGDAVLVQRPPAAVNGGRVPGSPSFEKESGGLSSPKAGGRHDRGPGQGLTLAELRQKNPPKVPERDDSFAVVSQRPIGVAGKPPAAFGGGGGGERLGFDESMTASGALAVVGSPGGRLPASSESIFGSGVGSGGTFSGGEARLGFDETMTARGPTASVLPQSPPKLFLGRDGAAAAAAGFESMLAADFFQKIALGASAGPDDPATRKPGKGGASSREPRSERAPASVESAHGVRRVGR